MENDSDSEANHRVPRKKKDRNRGLPHCKQNMSKKNNYGGIQSYCVLCKKYVMPGSKYITLSAETCFGKSSEHEYLKKGLGGNICNRDSDLSSSTRPIINLKRRRNPLRKNAIYFTEYPSAPATAGILIRSRISAPMCLIIMSPIATEALLEITTPHFRMIVGEI